MKCWECLLLGERDEDHRIQLGPRGLQTSSPFTQVRQSSFRTSSVERSLGAMEGEWRARTGTGERALFEAGAAEAAVEIP